MKLTVLPEGQEDSVRASLRREFGATESMQGLFDCDACNQVGRLTQTRLIEAAPELLRIQLSAVICGEETFVPNYNPIRINEHIDLNEHLVTQQQQGHVAPLKYRLHSVLYHTGDSGGGHYVASVRGPQDAYRVSDEQVSKLEPKSRLWESGVGRTRAMLLMYHREYPKSNDL